MEATLDREGTYQPLGFGGAFLEQFRLLWQSRRPLLLLIGILGVLALAGEPWTENELARLIALLPLWVLPVGPFWAFAVWHNEGPSNRLYFWSQPVSRATHTLARLAAGAAWLIIIYVVLLLAGLLFATFDGHTHQLAALGAASWVNYFTAPLLGYLVISVLTISSDYPIRWFLGLIFGTVVVGSLLINWLGLGELLERLFTPIIHQGWGLAATMVGPMVVAMAEMVGAGRPEAEFDLGTWWIAMPLWLLFWTAILVLLSRRHPDVFPRWHRSR